MLRACNRVLRRGGRTAFHVVYVAPGLSDRRRAQAIAIGPPCVSAPAGYPELLALAGFEEIDEVDLTDQFLVTATAWAEECGRAGGRLKAIFGAEEFRQSQQEREDTVAAIENGLLKRSLFTARAG